MEKSDKKSEIIKTVANMEYYPTVAEEKSMALEKYTQRPIVKLSAMGVAFEPLAASFQSVAGGSSSVCGKHQRGEPIV